MKVACLRYARRLSDRVHAPKLHQTPAANIDCISLVCVFGKDHKWQSFLHAAHFAGYRLRSTEDF